MRAIWLTEFGDPSVLVPGGAPDPEPGAGQVRVDVEVASISFVETQIRAGRPGPFPLPDPPFVPGNGVGGVVAAVGPDVDPALLGRRVFSTTGGFGGYAEKAAVAVTDVVEIPDVLSTADAVALATDGRTAVGLFRLAAPKAGETVLVEGAAGGLGSMLVQLALGAGARVIGAVGSDQKRDVVRKAGAEAVDYRQPDWADQVRKLVDGEAVDVVFDGVGGEIGATARGLVRTGSRFVVHGAAGGPMTDPASVAATGATVVTLWDIQKKLGLSVPQLAAASLAEGAAGRLKAVIGQVFPLERAADAHAAIGARTTVGKTLLLV
ncbi:zinc-binding dehydrogenase [Cryptosporangium aurantiacum]|uniref:NADPH2:quinone reductase n=1 Tax=Cryptosporangium aurantiacum TaxID=134849 RepID=A0A1M7RE31_9ACTN|nr:zinc-binding dehydrogenase [Cryptosporangium aurantiacum]SHN44525.1 NADPH2:quinone reductase [Cryptosporangium aurantiacum]